MALGRHDQPICALHLRRLLLARHKRPIQHPSRCILVALPLSAIITATATAARPPRIPIQRAQLPLPLLALALHALLLRLHVHRHLLLLLPGHNRTLLPDAAHLRRRPNGRIHIDRLAGHQQPAHRVLRHNGAHLLLLGGRVPLQMNGPVLQDVLALGRMVAFVAAGLVVLAGRLLVEARHRRLLDEVARMRTADGRRLVGGGLHGSADYKWTARWSAMYKNTKQFVDWSAAADAAGLMAANFHGYGCYACGLP